MLPMTVSATLCPLCPFFHHPCYVPLLEGTGYTFYLYNTYANALILITNISEMNL